MKLNFWNSLSLMFIYLKLTDIIDWSWWYILMPIYGTILLKSIIETINNNKKQAT